MRARLAVLEKGHKNRLLVLVEPPAEDPKAPLSFTYRDLFWRQGEGEHARSFYRRVDLEVSALEGRVVLFISPEDAAL